MITTEFITWATIGKLAAAGIGLYVVQPILLVLRDATLWKFIDSFILNSDLKLKIVQFVTAETEMADAPLLGQVVLVDGSSKYELDGRPVSKSMYDTTEAGIKRASQELQAARAFISSRRRRLDWLLRHYKQPDQNNPIDEWIAAEVESRRQLSEKIESIQQPV